MTRKVFSLSDVCGYCQIYSAYRSMTFWGMVCKGVEVILALFKNVSWTFLLSMDICQYLPLAFPRERTKQSCPGKRLFTVAGPGHWSVHNVKPRSNAFSWFKLCVLFLSKRVQCSCYKFNIGIICFSWQVL